MRTESDLQRLLCRKDIKLVVAFLAPILILLLVYNGFGIYPYENLTVLTSDLNNQYVSYFAYLVDSIREGNNIFYTFSKAIGGDMYGLTGYYLLSPVNIILMFVNKVHLPFMLMIVTMIKVGLSGLFMYIYLSSKRGYIYKNTMFAIAYALNGYMVAFIFNLMWLDAVYLLPLVILGVERIYKKKSCIPYISVLALTIISCYYTGYMVCIFTGIYAVYYFIIRNESFKTKFKSFVIFAGSSLLAVGISMVVLLPSLSALSGSKEMGGDTFGLTLETNYSIKDFLSCFFTGQNVSVEGYEKMPNLYFGIVMLVFLIGFFVNNKIKVKEKIATFGVLAFLVLSMYFVMTDMVWHGFAKPNMFYCRYSFVFSFMAIIIAEKCYHRIHGLSKIWQQAIIFAIVIVMVIANGIFIGDISVIKFMVLDVVVIAVTMIVIMYYYKIDKDLIAVLNIVLVISTVIGTYVNTKVEFSNLYFADNSISGYIEELKPCVDYVENKMEGEYRIEKTFYYSTNDPMLLSYNGLSHFSSTEKAYVKEFMKDMGYMAYYEYWTHYGFGSTYAADSLLGVKYIMTREPIHNRYQVIGKTDKIYVYENEYALPLVFKSSSDILDVEKTEDMNTFQYQNIIYSGLVGKKVVLFKDITYENRFVDTKTGDVHYIVKAIDNGNIYMYFPNVETGAAEVYVNGSLRGQYFDSFGNGVIVLGQFETGNIVDVMIKPVGNGTVLSEPVVYVENVELLKECIEKIKPEDIVVTKKSSSKLTCDITVSEGEMVMTSIPYDEGWTVYVDGEKVETKEAFKTMLAFEVEAGAHTIVFSYISKYFIESLVISIISMVVFGGIVLYNVLEKRKKGAKNEVQSV